MDLRQKCKVNSLFIQVFSYLVIKGVNLEKLNLPQKYIISLLRKALNYYIIQLNVLLDNLKEIDKSVLGPNPPKRVLSDIQKKIVKDVVQKLVVQVIDNTDYLIAILSGPADSVSFLRMVFIDVENKWFLLSSHINSLKMEINERFTTGKVNFSNPNLDIISTCYPQSCTYFEF